LLNHYHWRSFEWTSAWRELRNLHFEISHNSFKNPFYLQKERNKKFKLLALDPNNKIIFATPNVINSLQSILATYET
jgi:hypothetical protein